MFGGNLGHQGLRAVPPGDAKQIGAPRDGLSSYLRHVHWFKAAHHEHLGSEVLSHAFQVEPFHLPATGFRVHDQVRV